MKNENMRVFNLFAFIFLAGFVCKAQNYPQEYFASPLNIPLALSGTFGELRGNHYHSGMDIKTQGKQGLAVLASASGHIVRIKVSAYGYGNTLYMAHPNGYTSVYAHLKEFNPEIEAWVKAQQYNKQSFEVNLFPPAIFKFTQGDEIAKSGNSGGSGGPHLHFEIRDSKTEETINPALFGLPVADNKRPRILHLYATPITSGSVVNGSTEQKEVALTNLGNGRFSGSFKGMGAFGLVVHTYDQQDLSTNKNGVFKISQYVNDTLTYNFTIDRFEFRETRYINAHMDFARYKRYKQLTHKCYVEPGDKFSAYQNVKNKGVIILNPNTKKSVRIVVEDAWGNSSTIQLTAMGQDLSTATTAPKSMLKWNTANAIKQDGVRIEMKSGTLYKNEDISLTSTPACSQCLSPIFQLGDATIPAHKRYNLAIHKDKLNRTEKLVWATLRNGKPTGGLTTKWQGDWLSARPREFGQFAIMQDTLRPTIKVLNFTNGKTVSAGNKVKVTASDNLSGVTKYKATIDGNWVLLKHDAKQNLYWHEFEDNLEKGSHVLTLIFTDEVGNTSTYQSVFTYQP